MSILRIPENGYKKNTNTLSQFLDLLRTHSRQATWLVSGVGDEGFDATGVGGTLLDEMARAGERVSGNRILKAAGQTRQVIWGRFIGYLPDHHERPWILIQSVDSSFYEIQTEDAAVVHLVKSSFDNVEEVSSLWQAPL